MKVVFAHTCAVLRVIKTSTVVYRASTHGCLKFTAKKGGGYLHREAVSTHNADTHETSDHQKWGVGTYITRDTTVCVVSQCHMYMHVHYTCTVTHIQYIHTHVHIHVHVRYSYIMASDAPHLP